MNKCANKNNGQSGSFSLISSLIALLLVLLIK